MRRRTGYIIALMLAGALGASAQTRQQIDQCLNKSKTFSTEQSATACVLADIEYRNRATKYEDAKDYARAAAEHETRARLPTGQRTQNEVAAASPWRDACLDRLAAGQIEQASKDCEAALTAAPTFPPAHDARGILYLRTGAWDKALADFEAALGVFPNEPVSYYGRGLAKLKIGDIAGGNADIARASNVQPDIATKFALYGVSADLKNVAAPPVCTASAGTANLALIRKCEAVYCAPDVELQARRNLKHIDDMLAELQLRTADVTAALQKFQRACRAIGGRLDVEGPKMEIFRVASYELMVSRSRLMDLSESMQKSPEENIFTNTSSAMARTYKQPSCMNEINQQTIEALNAAQDLIDKVQIVCPAK